MAILDIDKIAPDTSQKLMLGLTISAWVISFVYYTPEETLNLLRGVGLWNIAPAQDAPTIIPLLLFTWMLLGTLDATYIYLKVMSDTAIAEGMDNCESCVGGKLHIFGDWGWLRVGGTKAFPIEGGAVWIGLLTHIHRIGTHIIFTGAMTQKTVLDYVPWELKMHIRQRRSGLFGIETCSVGFITPKEMESHKEFDVKDFSEYLTDEEKSKPTINTAEFIASLQIKNKTIDMGLQLVENECDSLTKSLGTIKGVGAAIRTPQEKGILQHIFG